MIDRLIDWSLRNRFLVGCAVVLIVGWGIHSLNRTPMDAIPDLSENQVVVFADWPGRSPREVEDHVTNPLSGQFRGLAGVKTVRSSSMLGFSLLTVIFRDDVDLYFARSRVLERLNSGADILPPRVIPRLGPDATGLGWVFEYYLAVAPSKKSPGYDLGRLRAIQDWFVRPELSAVPGVAEVASVGGFVRQYQIEVSSAKMLAQGVTLQMVMEAVSQSNLNVGGKVIEENGQEFIVRGIGLIQSAEALENIAITQREGATVYLRSVAQVVIGGEFRRGALDVDGQEVVGGIVVMRTGENAREVIRGVKAKIRQLSAGLPPGVSIAAFYDRSELVERTIGTLKGALAEELVLVALVHLLFLFHFRSILIVITPLPLSILSSFILMRHFGIASNIMSLSGLAIAIGVVVDAGIVMAENVIRHAETMEKARGRPLTAADRWEATRAGTQQVGRPILFAMAIIILAFVPIFSLTGPEGKLFHPLAFTKTFAMAAAALLAVTLVPALCLALVRGPFQPETENWVMKRLLRLYEPALDWALSHRGAVTGLAGLFLALAFALAAGLPQAVQDCLRAAKLNSLARVAAGMGGEFMPALNEGSLLFMPQLAPGMSLTEVKRVMEWQDRVLKQTPEVASAAGKLGRADSATDPAPIEMIETTIMLKPPSAWRPGLTKETLIAELTEKLGQLPGYVPGFLQPIEGRVLMLSTGLRAQLGIKIFGEDPVALQGKALEVEQIVRQVPGATGVAASRTLARPYVEIELDREAIGRAGLRAEQVLDSVEAGIGGRNLSTALEGRERIPIQIRLQRSEREEIESLGKILVAAPSGQPLPLGRLATIRRTLGPGEFTGENGRLFASVQANVHGRDLAGFVRESQRKIARAVKLAPGMTIQWSGQYEDQLRAQRSLRLIAPMVLATIFVLLTLLYRSMREASYVLLAVPFALTGGIFLQFLLGYPFSVAVWVGYIALFGTAIQTAVVMVVYLDEALSRKRAELARELTAAELVAAVKEGARLRLRPKLMTVAAIVASLLPIMWSTRTGSEIMKPLAAPIIGGMLSSLLHIMILTPVLFAWSRSGARPDPRSEGMLSAGVSVAAP